MQMHNVLKLCQKYFSLSFDEIAHSGTHRDASDRRALVMSAMYALGAKASYPRIGEIFGKHHTSVLSACQKTWAKPYLIARLAHLIKYINQQVAA